QRFPPRRQRVLRNRQFQVEFTHLEIRNRDVRHQRADHLLPVPLRGEKICSRRLRSAPVSPPKIHIPGKQGLQLEIAESESRQPLRCKSRPGGYSRKLVRPRHANLSLRLQNTARGNLYIVIVLQPSSNQVL